MVELEGNKVNIILQERVDNSYEVIIDTDLFPKIARDLSNRTIGKCAIITDSHVGPLYARKLEKELMKKGLESAIFSFPAGERSKAPDIAFNIGRRMAKNKFDRRTKIIALGGGCVGDLAGYISHNYLRGVELIQFPTTLLAAADASIGGKVAVNMPEGKNLWGGFKQPKAVYIDLNILRELPEKLFSEGLAETVKHGVIASSEFFSYLERNRQAILNRKEENLRHIALMNCKIKGSIVEQDPQETKGIRRILNFGHTIGHAIESLSDYKISHGDCVSIGSNVEAWIAYCNFNFPLEHFKRQKELTKSFSLITSVPSRFTTERIIKATATDKKGRSGIAEYAMPKKIGEMHSFMGRYTTTVNMVIIRNALEVCR